MPMFPLRVRGPFDLKPASGTTMWASFAFPHKPLIIVVLTGVPQTTGYCWWIIWHKCSEKLASKSAPVVAEPLWVGGGRGTEGSVEKLGCQ